jgi:hypothetical protein
MIVRGSIESDTAEVTVRPVRSSPSPAVTTLTPPATRRIASFSGGAETGSAIFEMAFMTRPR